MHTYSICFQLFPFKHRLIADKTVSFKILQLRFACLFTPNLLIDIQVKMQQIHSPGFERWEKIFYLKEMAKTVMYLQENNLTDLGELEKSLRCSSPEIQRFG